MVTDTKELNSLLHVSIENIDDEELLRAAKLFWIVNTNLVQK